MKGEFVRWQYFPFFPYKYEKFEFEMKTFISVWLQWVVIEKKKFFYNSFALKRKSKTSTEQNIKNPFVYRHKNEKRVSQYWVCTKQKCCCDNLFIHFKTQNL